MLSTAYPGNFCPKVLGKLYRISTYTARSAIDKNFLSALDISFSKKRQCCKSSTRDGGGFLIGHIGRFYCHQPFFRPTVFWQTSVLGISAKTKTGKCKDLVTFFKSLYIFAY